MTHKQGWKLCFAAGLFPFTVGLSGYATAFVKSTLLQPEEPYLVIWKITSFTLDAVMGFNHEAGVFLGVLSCTFWQLLIVFGATISTVAYFGIRTAQRWSWFFLLAAITWGAGNDTMVSIYLWQNDVMNIPTPLFVDALGFAGLFLSRDILRSDGVGPPEG